MVRAADAPAIKPAVELGTPLLLTIAAAGIALLLVMIIRFKIQAFVALLTVSILVAVAAQIPLKDVFTVVATGVGSTMGKVALLIALGAILGRMIEVSGGVQSLATHFTEKLGAKRVAVALTAVGLPGGHPRVLRGGRHRPGPDRLRLRQDRQRPPGQVRPAHGRHHAVHPRCRPAAPRHCGRRRRLRRGHRTHHPDLAHHLHPPRLPVLLGCQHHEPQGLRTPPRRQGSRWKNSVPNPWSRLATRAPAPRAIAPPRPGLIIFLIAAPIVQILLGTVGTLTIPKDNYWYGVAAFIGNPFFALLVAVALSFFLLAVRRNWSLKETGEIFEGALPPIASILMVVAAGGVFGEVLRTSGIGAALSQTLDQPGPAGASCSASSSPWHCAPPRVRPPSPS